MSRIRVNIDRLVLNGFQSLEGKALVAALQSQLSQALSEQGTRESWGRSYRAPILKLGPMPMESGSAGAGKFGKQMASAVVRQLKP